MRKTHFSRSSDDGLFAIYAAAFVVVFVFFLIIHLSPSLMLVLTEKEEESIYELKVCTCSAKYEKKMSQLMATKANHENASQITCGRSCCTPN
jgi:hypothetical protein